MQVRDRKQDQTWKCPLDSLRGSKVILVKAFRGWEMGKGRGVGWGGNIGLSSGKQVKGRSGQAERPLQGWAAEAGCRREGAEERGEIPVARGACWMGAVPCSAHGAGDCGLGSGRRASEQQRSEAICVQGKDG